MPSDLKLAGLLPAEIADRYDRTMKRIEELPEGLLADVLELMADLSDIAARALPAPTQLSREMERLTSELDEARRFGGLGCDANAGGPHEIIKEGSYQFCGKCGETIRQPSLKERARAAEARAEAAESQLSRKAQSRDEVVKECAKVARLKASGFADLCETTIDQRTLQRYRAMQYGATEVAVAISALAPSAVALELPIIDEAIHLFVQKRLALNGQYEAVDILREDGIYKIVIDDLLAMRKRYEKA